MGDVRTALLALAHPGSVLALVVLALNDHVLKQAWPGWVTGKLSDVAGLVVFPLLLAVGLAVLRLPRSLPVAMALTGAGFVVVKGSAEGAVLVSALWSTGFPTVMRADVTDLLALPALGIAWWLDADVRRRPFMGWRNGVALAAGMAMLPLGVFATAATSCDGDDGLRTINAVQGGFTGTQDRLAFVVSDDVSGYVRIDPLSGQVDGLDDRDVDRLRDTRPIGACDRTGVECWRLEDFEKVQSSVDGGATWRDDLVVSAEEQAESVEDVDPGCGREASARLTFLAVADVAGVPAVVVTATHLGVWWRGPDGDWDLITRAEIAAAPTDAPGGPSPRGKLRVVATPPRSEHGQDRPTNTPLPPGCASPATVTVTPNPSNGPPTTYEVCPTSPSPSSD
jgi:hypothetical protein